MITLTPDQQVAADEFAAFMISDNEQCMAITGWSGCGKTTLVEYLLKDVSSKQQLMNLLVGRSSSRDLDIYVTAPTNTASKVIGEMTGYEPKTIQSLLGLTVKNDYRTGKTSLVRSKNYKKYTNSLIMIDEGSFIGPDLLKETLQSTKGCKVLFVMDPYQLAPPKEKDIAVDSMKMRRAALTTINRNPGPIAVLAGQYREAVKTGIFPKLAANGKEIIHADGAGFKQLIEDEFLRPNRADNSGRILAWTNARVIEYNDHVRSIRGLPPQISVGEHMVTNQPIMKADQILVQTDTIVEITEVYHGVTRNDVPGTLVRTSHSDHRVFVPKDKTQVAAKLRQLAQAKEWGDYFEIKNEWADLRPTFSSTVHKAQGATVGTVFVDLSDIGRNNDAEEVARLLYVAISRAAKQVVLYGQLPTKYGG